MRKTKADPLDYVDRVLADLEKKLGISKRAPKITKEPWLDDGVTPPVVRVYMSGWFSAEELRKAASRIDTPRPLGS